MSDKFSQNCMRLYIVGECNSKEFSKLLYDYSFII